MKLSKLMFWATITVSVLKYSSGITNAHTGVEAVTEDGGMHAWMETKLQGSAGSIMQALTRGP